MGFITKLAKKYAFMIKKAIGIIVLKRDEFEVKKSASANIPVVPPPGGQILFSLLSSARLRLDCVDSASGCH